MSEDGIKLEVGDRVLMKDCPIYRPRWQFWRPKIIGYEDQMYVVTNLAEGRLDYLHTVQE